jgi:hypothetical protein
VTAALVLTDLFHVERAGLKNLTRRRLLQAGAAGTVLAGLGPMAGTVRAEAAAAKIGGIHIHASLKQTGGPISGFARLVDITVYGTDDDLSGSGWNAQPESVGSSEPAHPDRSQSFFSQRGSVQGDTVNLRGRNLFWWFPTDDGALVTVEANLATGQIKFAIQGSEGTYIFEGIGVAARI